MRKSKARGKTARTHYYRCKSVTNTEVRLALRKMKNGKAVGPDEIPVEAWKCIGEPAVKVMTRLFNRLLKGEKMPDEWRKSVLVPVFKEG